MSPTKKEAAPKAEKKAKVAKAPKAEAAKKEAAPKKEPKAKKAQARTAGPVTLHHYDVLVRPLVTEKSTRIAEQNKVVFAIAPSATKRDVKQAVESLFNVTVKKVNTMNVEGKIKRFRGNLGQRRDTRKAIVTLAEGQSIDFAAGR